MAKYLYRLQEIDTRLNSIQLELDTNSGDPEVALREQLAQLEKETEEEEQKLRAITDELKDKQLQLETLKEKERERKKKLESSSSVRGLKYAEAVLGDLNRQILVVEGQIRRLLQEQNSLQRKLEQFLEQKREREARLKSLVEEMQKKRVELEMERENLHKERQELQRFIPPRILQLYDRKKILKKGTAVSRVEPQNNTCSECRFTLPLITIHQVQKNGLNECPNCGRILVWLE
ncbi:MAG: zinc ribbon domain-containing protein [bacterium JZ-2024 1]